MNGNYAAFINAAGVGQVETLKYLAAQLPDELPAMIVAHDYSALQRGTFSVQSNLLRFPLAFSYAELHYEERWTVVLKSFMNDWVGALQARSSLEYPSVIFSKEEAQLGFYMLRHLIRTSTSPNDPKVAAQVTFLLPIPCV